MAGNFFGGLFFGGGFFGAITPPTPSGSTPSGVRGQAKKRPPILRLRDVERREDISDFLKSQLRIRHPDTAFVDTSAQDAEKAKRLLARQARREAEMRRKAELAEARFAKEKLEAERMTATEIEIQNNNMRILIMLASAV